jgi:hypothetical protein
LIGVGQLDLDLPPQHVEIGLDLMDEREQVTAVVGPIVTSGLGAAVDVVEVLVHRLWRTANM